MRVALILLAVVGCSKQSATPRAEEPAAAPPPVTALQAPPAPTGDTATATATASPADERVGGAESAKAGEGTGSALDDARASGVLGPTDRAAFEVRGKITIKTKVKALDEAVRSKLDAVQACYDKVLAFEENLAGELTLQARAGKLVVLRATLKHAELEKCVLDALASATLPKLGKATITLAFARE